MSRNIRNVKYFLGVDVGNGYTKSRKVKFESRVSMGRGLKVGNNRNTYSVNYNGMDYVVGRGKHFTQTGRHLTDNYLLCLLVAIAENFKHEDVIDLEVTVGLPFQEYMNVESSLVDDILNKLTNPKGFDINIDGRDVHICIHEATVYPEGTYPIYKEKMGNVLGIDMGMGTINIAQFLDMGVIFHKTIPDAMNSLYLKLQDAVNNTYTGADVSLDTIVRYFDKDEIPVNQEMRDARFLRKYIEEHVANLFGMIEGLVKVADIEEIYLMGGGGIATERYWKKHIPKIQLVPHAQDINAEILDEIARMEFNEARN